MPPFPRRQEAICIAFLLEGITSPEVRNKLSGIRPAVIPTGSCEQNGPHGTVGIVDPTREFVVVFLTQSRGNTVRRRVVAAVMEALGGDGRD